jgi:hypothetical protein
MPVPKSKWSGRLCRSETTWDHRRHSPNSAIVVLLHEYGRFLGAYIMDICCHGTNIVICDAWLYEGVFYHTPGGNSSLMNNYGSPISLPIISFYSILGP